MTENFEYKGEWFLPSEKSNRVIGILKFDILEGISLELLGSFRETPLIPFMQYEDIIQGVTSDSQQITLLNCYPKSVSSPKIIVNEEIGIPSALYSINFILEGEHIDNVQEIRFQRVVAEIHNLSEWIGITGFEYGYNDSAGEKSYEVNYKLPPQINFMLKDDLNGQFNFIFDSPRSINQEKNLSLNQRVQLIISSKNEHSIDDLLKYLFCFQNFLVLALYSKTFPKNISLFSKKYVKQYNNERQKEIKLYFRISDFTQEKKIKLNSDAIFTYDNIKDDFPEIISSWFKKYDILEPAFNLLFEQFYRDHRFSENTFLNLAQSAETFHARTRNHTKMPKEEFSKMKEDIYSVVPDKYHHWLKDQFNFGNNLNLHTRLTEIVEHCSTTFLDKVVGDKEQFVNHVKWSRNYYTHYSSDGSKKALKGKELFYLTEKLKIVLTCAFLIEVGLKKEKLEHLLEKNKFGPFRYLATLNNKK